MTKKYCKVTTVIDKLFVTFSDFKGGNPKVQKLVEHNLQLLEEKTAIKLTGFYTLNRKEIINTQKWLKVNGYYAFELDKFVIKPTKIGGSISTYGYRVYNKKGKIISTSSSVNDYVIAVDEQHNPYLISLIYNANEKRNRFVVYSIKEEDDNLWDNDELFRIDEDVDYDKDKFCLKNMIGVRIK